MIISHSRKFCYWKIARTGSNTAELCIRMSGVLDLTRDVVTSCHFFPAEHNIPSHRLGHQSGHTLPHEAISIGALSWHQYQRYDHYTIVRDPIERWISAYAYWCRMHLREKLTPEQFFQLCQSANITKRQSQYLEMGRVHTFPFSDYERSIRAIVAAIGGRLEDVPRLEHKTRGLWLRNAHRELPKLRDTLLDRYADDMLLNY